MVNVCRLSMVIVGLALFLVPLCTLDITLVGVVLFYAFSFYSVPLSWLLILFTGVRVRF